MLQKTLLKERERGLAACAAGQVSDLVTGRLQGALHFFVDPDVLGLEIAGLERMLGPVRLLDQAAIRVVVRNVLQFEPAATLALGRPASDAQQSCAGIDRLQNRNG